MDEQALRNECEIAQQQIEQIEATWTTPPQADGWESTVFELNQQLDALAGRIDRE
jgi:hypothetical protein